MRSRRRFSFALALILTIVLPALGQQSATTPVPQSESAGAVPIPTGDPQKPPTPGTFQKGDDIDIVIRPSQPAVPPSTPSTGDPGKPANSGASRRDNTQVVNPAQSASPQSGSVTSKSAQPPAALDVSASLEGVWGGSILGPITLEMVSPQSDGTFSFRGRWQGLTVSSTITEGIYNPKTRVLSFNFRQNSGDRAEGVAAFNLSSDGTTLDGNFRYRVYPLPGLPLPFYGDPIGWKLTREGSPKKTTISRDPRCVSTTGFPGDNIACPQNEKLVCIAEAPTIPIDPRFPESPEVYQPGFDFSGIDYAPNYPDKLNSGLTKWMRYDCTIPGRKPIKLPSQAVATNNLCSFVAPGVADDGHGVKTKVRGDGTVPVSAEKFEVDPPRHTGDVDDPFLTALKNNYQCIPSSK